MSAAAPRSARPRGSSWNRSFSRRIMEYSQARQSCWVLLPAQPLDRRVSIRWPCTGGKVVEKFSVTFISKRCPALMVRGAAWPSDTGGSS